MYNFFMTGKTVSVNFCWWRTIEPNLVAQGVRVLSKLAEKEVFPSPLMLGAKKWSRTMRIS